MELPSKIGTPPSQLLISASALSFTSGCAGVNPVVDGNSLAIESQSLSYKGIAGKTRVELFNTTSILLWPSPYN